MVTEWPQTLMSPDPFYTNWWFIASVAAWMLGFGKACVRIINLHTGEYDET